MATIFLAFFLTLFAGIFNGSYPGVLKKLSAFNQDLVWASFSFFAFFLFPLIATALVVPQWPTLLSLLPEKFFITCMIGGFLFGLGMICFTIALRFIGIGIAFVLNISFGTIFGSLLPVFFTSPARIFTSAGIVDLLALLAFILSVTCSSRAASIRDSAQKNSAHMHLTVGLLMGTLSGVLCAAQGAAFGLATPLLTSTASTNHIIGNVLSLPWIVIFWSAFVPYFLFYFIKGAKTLNSRTGAEMKAICTRSYYLAIMGFLYYSALVIYSYAVGFLGNYGNVVGWPLLMAAIILTSNFWGWKRGEWLNAPQKSKRLMVFSIILMIVAVMFLGISASIAL